MAQNSVVSCLRFCLSFVELGPGLGLPTPGPLSFLLPPAISHMEIFLKCCQECWAAAVTQDCGGYVTTWSDGTLEGDVGTLSASSNSVLLAPGKFQDVKH